MADHAPSDMDIARFIENDLPPRAARVVSSWIDSAPDGPSRVARVLEELQLAESLREAVASGPGFALEQRIQSQLMPRVTTRISSKASE